jgi:tetratricopeptide (TPR) repeat protein
VGCIYGDLGDHEKELEFQLKALEIRKATLPENHPDLARSYNNVGYTYFALGNLEEALRCTQQAVAIAEISLSEGHPSRTLYQENLAYLKQLMGMQ